jgi:hypothetical protein
VLLLHSPFLFQEGSSISRQNLNENLETLHLVQTLFYLPTGFYLKKGYLNSHPLSLFSSSLFFLREEKKGKK